MVISEQNISLALSFAPFIAFAFISLIMYKTKSFTFKKMGLIFVLASLSRLILAIPLIGIGDFWITVAQLFISIIGFIIIVFFISNTSWETIVTMTSMLALTPLFHGVPAFFITYVLFAIYTLFIVGKREMKDLIYDAIVSSGMAQSLPNYSHLPDKEAKKGQKRVTLLPFILIAYTGNALYFVFSSLWLES